MEKQECSNCGEYKDKQDFVRRNQTMNICQECQETIGLSAPVTGAASEYFALGSLLLSYPDTMLASHATSAHDLIIHLDRGINIRTQVKTARSSIPLKGGTRGGADRADGHGKDKSFRYTSDRCDLIIGVQFSSFPHFDLFFLPSLVVDKLEQQSISINKISFTKNDIQIVEHCLDETYAEEYLQKIN